MRTKMPARLAMLALLPFAVGACTAISRNALDCASLIGPALREPTSPAELPSENTLGAWVAFGDEQTGRLEVAETKREAVIETVDRCGAAQERMERPWWRLW